MRWQRNTKDWVPIAQRNAAAGEQARKELDDLIGIFERELGNKAHVLGDAISLVDFHLASMFQWIGYCGVDLKAFPKTSAWMQCCEARPSHAKAAAAEA